MPDIPRVDDAFLSELLADPVLWRLLPELGDPAPTGGRSKLAILRERLRLWLAGSPPFVFEAITDLRNAEGTVSALRTIRQYPPQNPTEREAPTALIGAWIRRLDALDFRVVFEGWPANTPEFVRLAQASAELRDAVADMLQRRYGVVRSRPGTQSNDLLVHIHDVLEEVCPKASSANMRVASAWILHRADVRPLSEPRARLILEGDGDELRAVSRVVANIIKRRGQVRRPAPPPVEEPASAHAKALVSLAREVRRLSILELPEGAGSDT
ncbi:MAG: hypothetical protein JJ863_36855 [Deltaproteobacteria bacterium]|nr:hypothetical protein [Deltaproteobacteria bacterium]